MAQSLLIPKSDAAQTQPVQPEASSTTVFEPPMALRRSPALRSWFNSTTNCAVHWIDLSLTPSLPATLDTQPCEQLGREPTSVADVVAEAIQNDLADGREPLGQRAVPPVAQSQCIAVGRDIAPLVHDEPGVRYAAFWDDDEKAASLVIHCSRTKRQITFDFAPNGRTTCSRIDEYMHRVSVELDASNPEEAREWVAWLKRRG